MRRPERRMRVTFMHELAATGADRLSDTPLFSPVVLRVDAAEGDAVDGVVPPEEDPETDADVRKSRGTRRFLNGTTRTYRRWLSVSVMPCDVTLNWTTVAAGRGCRPRVASVALAIAWGPVRDSVSTEFR